MELVTYRGLVQIMSPPPDSANQGAVAFQDNMTALADAVLEALAGTTSSAGVAGQVQITDGNGNFVVGTNPLSIDLTTGAISGVGGLFTVDQYGNAQVGGNNIFLLGGEVTGAVFYRTNSFAVGAGNITSSGFNNTGLGSGALLEVDSGAFNTAVGSGALNSLIAATGNTAVGAFALSHNTYNSNTAIGYQSLFFNSTGQENTAIGFHSGFNTSPHLTDCSYMTFLGAETTATTDGLSNSTAIGWGATVTASNQIMLGNSSVTEVITNGDIQASSFTGTSLNITTIYETDGEWAYGTDGLFFAEDKLIQWSSGSLWNSTPWDTTIGRSNQSELTFGNGSGGYAALVAGPLSIPNSDSTATLISTDNTLTLSDENNEEIVYEDGDGIDLGFNLNPVPLTDQSGNNLFDESGNPIYVDDPPMACFAILSDVKTSYNDGYAGLHLNSIYLHGASSTVDGHGGWIRWDDNVSIGFEETINAFSNSQGFNIPSVAYINISQTSSALVNNLAIGYPYTITISGNGASPDPSGVYVYYSTYSGRPYYCPADNPDWYVYYESETSRWYIETNGYWISTNSNLSGATFTPQEGSSGSPTCNSFATGLGAAFFGYDLYMGDGSGVQGGNIFLDGGSLYNVSAIYSDYGATSFVGGNSNLWLDTGYDIRFNGQSDTNWRMGILNAFSTSIITRTRALNIVSGQGNDGGYDGIALGQCSDGSSILELRGHDSAAYFAGNIVDSSGRSIINLGARELIDETGFANVLFASSGGGGRKLNTNGRTTVDWGSSLLLAHEGGTAFDWSEDNGGVINLSQITSGYSAIDVMAGLFLHSHNIQMNNNSGSGGGNIDMEQGSILNCGPFTADSFFVTPSKIGNLQAGFVGDNEFASSPTLDMGLNPSQFGSRNTDFIGSIFRLDSRADLPFFSIRYQPSGGSAEYTPLQITETGNVLIGNGWGADNNTGANNGEDLQVYGDTYIGGNTTNVGNLVAKAFYGDISHLLNIKSSWVLDSSPVVMRTSYNVAVGVESPVGDVSLDVGSAEDAVVRITRNAGSNQGNITFKTSSDNQSNWSTLDLDEWNNIGLFSWGYLGITSDVPSWGDLTFGDWGSETLDTYGSVGLNVPAWNIGLLPYSNNFSIWIDNNGDITSLLNADIGVVNINGAVIADSFVGDGSQLTGVTAAPTGWVYSAGATSSGLNRVLINNPTDDNETPLQVNGNAVFDGVVQATTKFVGFSGGYNNPTFMQPNSADSNWAFGSYNSGSQFWMQALYFDDNSGNRGFRVYDAASSEIAFSTNKVSTTISGRALVHGATDDNSTALQVNGGAKISGQISQVVSALTDAGNSGTISWDVSSASIATLTLAGTNETLTISNAIAGTTYILQITQGSGGNFTIGTWTNFKWANGSQPILSTAAGAIDVITIITLDGTNFLGVCQNAFS